ncbi:MAG: hypothetical protein NTV43_17480 [Methylococcales bacterium]|nr:hypothetical protein [Methylococcales bacterium]
MIIRLALLLLFAALTLFISVDVLLALAMPGLPGFLTQLGLAALFGGFALLLASGLWLLLKAMVLACFDYFSVQQRAARRVLFVQGQQDAVQRRYYFRLQQLNYFNRIRRKKLLVANDKQHLKSLSLAITKDLQSIRPKLPKASYQQLYNEHIQCRKQRDIEALLRLQQKITRID